MRFVTVWIPAKAPDAPPSTRWINLDQVTDARLDHGTFATDSGRPLGSRRLRLWMTSVEPADVLGTVDWTVESRILDLYDDQADAVARALADAAATPAA